MSPSFSTPPYPSSSVTPFTVDIPSSFLASLRSLLQLSKIGPATWENTQPAFGTTHKWLSEAREAWLDPSVFLWHSHQLRINAIPNFISTQSLSDLDFKWTQGIDYNLHFLGLFSSRKDALPVVVLHGFPGSFMEYLPVLELLKRKYTPETLPYHIIVPSLPGYGFSSFSAASEEDVFVKAEFDFYDAANILNQLMVQLGFGERYIAHGGDVGTLLSRILAETFDGCKAFHMNGLFATKETPPNDMEGYTEEDKQRIANAQAFFATGTGYSVMHQTKPGTVGFTVASNPLSLLAWIGEKLCDWAEDPPPIDTILANVTLYWATDTYPRCIYSNRFPASIPFPAEKPFGVSNYPFELVPAPKAWVEKTFPNLIFYKDYERGGHFPALEEPEAMLAGLEEFLAKVRPMIHEDTDRGVSK
ncbi:hypothetical protein CkaCkLH20_08545 [Colletotrichum karsti]|uniref:Epoxide hydrolase N-terminal domain-containing protein n=1 Tax=Colletotrichum karsti TaxID=1095194 RepID=A0A9P6LI25_9PEZI|nr:uncharacterized protein CkaCkLH20_08545 [Colletotrichum karsti]KAF9873811.1 hypothetical protein CkaCkLH20_08545 [Colletotrichum karsti]